MTSSLPPPHLAGELIDSRYRLVREIAAGGMGVVWEAEHVGLKKAVAVKLLHQQIADDPGLTARFEREARATSQLDHPNIVRVTDYGRTPEGQRYLVLELLVGRSLSALLAEDGPLDPARAIALVDQLLAGLGAAHERQLVHRDLKPDNIFVVTNSQGAEQVKILDFGIASLRGDQASTRLTQTGAVMGTPAYMSPEQAMGRPAIDGRSDLHAVGVILYELLCNRPAYDGENYNQVMHAILVGRTTPLEQLRPGLPSSLYAAIDRAMAGPVDERHTDAQAFRVALSGAAGPVAPSFRLPASLATTAVGERQGSASIEIASSTEPLLASSTAPLLASSAEPPLAGPEATRPRRYSEAFGQSDEPVLELDRPTPSAAAVASAAPRRGHGPLIAIALVLLAAAGGLVLPRLVAPQNAIIELTAVPPATRLTLDGEPLLGHRLVLPISSRKRLLTIASPGQAPRQMIFTADRDQTLSLASEGQKR